MYALHHGARTMRPVALAIQKGRVSSLAAWHTPDSEKLPLLLFPRMKGM